MSGRDSISWEYKQQVQELNDIPVALEMGIQQLIVPFNDFYVSKDGQYCVFSQSIYSLPQWTKIQDIDYENFDCCYFTSDNQYILVGKMINSVNFYYIHNIHENKGVKFPWMNQEVTRPKVWTKNQNSLNILFAKQDSLLLCRMDKKYNFKYIKSIYRPYHQDQIHRMLILEGATSNKCQRKLNTNMNNFQITTLHMNQYLFLIKPYMSTKIYMKHLVCGKVIRIINKAQRVKIVIKNIFIWQKEDIISFYDFTRGQVVFTVSYNKTKMYNMVVILGDHLTMRARNGDYFGWLIK